jgi:hypothetical protein
MKGFVGRNAIFAENADDGGKFLYGIEMLVEVRQAKGYSLCVFGGLDTAVVQSSAPSRAIFVTVRTNSAFGRARRRAIWLANTVARSVIDNVCRQT